MDKKVDPGWNDPPMLNYDASNPPPKSRITNKRVAFPLSGNSSNPNSGQGVPTGSAPKLPPLPSVLPPPPASGVPIVQETFSPEELFKKVKENFDEVLNRQPETNRENIQVLFKMWGENKFGDHCQNYIYLFSKHLIENNKIDALQLKEKLLSEFQDTCKEWLDNFNI